MEAGFCPAGRSPSACLETLSGCFQGQGPGMGFWGCRLSPSTMRLGALADPTQHYPGALSLPPALHLQPPGPRADSVGWAAICCPDSQRAASGPEGLWASCSPENKATSSESLQPHTLWPWREGGTQPTWVKEAASASPGGVGGSWEGEEGRARTHNTSREQLRSRGNLHHCL